MMPEIEHESGIENTREHYEYSDQPLKIPIHVRTNSSSTLKTPSSVSSKEFQTFPSSNPNGEARKGTPVLQTKKVPRPTPTESMVVPQTDV